MPLTWLGSQRYVIEEVSAGLKQDIHSFVILKGRQMGISTVSLALDLYWHFKYPGLQGAVVTDTDDNREVFRSLLTQYMNSLPRKYRPDSDSHNRTQLILSNESRLQYMVAGTKKQSGGLGRAKSANYMHATECSSWGDEEGYMSLMNSLAQENPIRLYLYESTARGYNMFYQQWETAKASKTQKAIFAGWWRNEFYSKSRQSIDFKTYWDGAPTSDERVWIGEIFERYKFSVTAEQIAWWRWYCEEQMHGDETMAMQEMPPTEDYAFQLSGSKYFSAERINLNYRKAIATEPLYFRYKFGLNFEDTEFIQTNEDMADITVWEWPEPKGVYSFGCDPAYGSSEWADEFAASMLRCYADRVCQVLEIGTPNWTEQQYAWAIAHLAGFYGPNGNCMLSLEMQGPGGAVFNELNNLKRFAGAMKKGDPRLGALDVIGGIRNYLWKKQDSLNAGYAYQWQTNTKEKIRMFSTLRSYFERDMIDINSAECVDQFRRIHRNGDQIGGDGRAKDDRVVALAIAVMGWNDWLMHELVAENRTYVLEHREPEVKKIQSPVEHCVSDFFRKQGITFGGMK